MERDRVSRDTIYDGIATGSVWPEVCDRVKHFQEERERDRQRERARESEGEAVFIDDKERLCCSYRLRAGGEVHFIL